MFFFLNQGAHVSSFTRQPHLFYFSPILLFLLLFRRRLINAEERGTNQRMSAPKLHELRFDVRRVDQHFRDGKVMERYLAKLEKDEEQLSEYMEEVYDRPFDEVNFSIYLTNTSVSQVLYPRTLTDTEKIRPDMKMLKTESKTLIDPPPPASENFCSHRILEGFYLQVGNWTSNLRRLIYR